MTRVAARAGVELSPAACWLLARLSEAHAPALATLAAQFEIDLDTLTAAREELAHKHLIEPSPNGDPSARALTADGHATLERLIATGEQRLCDLLEGWRPEEHEELARMIATLARQFFIDASSLCAPLEAAAAVP